MAETLRALARDPVEAQGLRCPGAVSLACAAKGGVLKRAGATEAAIDLARLAGLEPHVALQAELKSAGWEALRELAAEAGIPFTTTADVVAHVRRNEALVERCGLPAKMPTKHGLFMVHCFKSLVDGIEHIALVKAPDDAGDEAPFSLSSRPALVRVHSECCTGDIFGSLHSCAVQEARPGPTNASALSPPHSRLPPFPRLPPAAPARAPGALPQMLGEPAVAAWVCGRLCARAPPPQNPHAPRAKP